MHSGVEADFFADDAEVDEEVEGSGGFLVGEGLADYEAVVGVAEDAFFVYYGDYVLVKLKAYFMVCQVDTVHQNTYV